MAVEIPLRLAIDPGRIPTCPYWTPNMALKNPSMALYRSIDIYISPYP